MQLSLTKYRVTDILICISIIGALSNQNLYSSSKRSIKYLIPDYQKVCKKYFISYKFILTYIILYYDILLL